MRLRPDWRASTFVAIYTQTIGEAVGDDTLIKAILDKNAARYGANLNDGDVFEYFCAETALRQFSLSLDEIEKGIVDGQNDGGIDSAYVFVNRTLISIDTDLEIFKSPVVVDLYVIQSKVDKGFREEPISKLQTSVPKLISLDADPTVLETVYNHDVREVFGLYRDCLKDLADRFPKVNVHIIYATLATSPNEKVDALIPDLEKVVVDKFPQSTCRVELWGASRLYEEAQKQQVFVKKLPFVKSPISHGKGYVFLATLQDYHDFITESGQLIDALFEFNVRDYQSNAAVNKEIAATLKDTSDHADFWWLNNGITMLAEEAQSQDNKLTIKNPLIVNGLQTSHEIFRHFSSGGTDPTKRSVQVRVLEIDDEARRDRVIKATNSQTGIKPASLHATEPLQRKIEDFFLQLGIFYDRRKDYWRNKGKPVGRIISIERLAQSMISIFLERPHDARARPTTIMKSEDDYNAIFSQKIDLHIYKVCAEIYFLVHDYLKKHNKNIDPLHRNNLRYHVMMQLAWHLNKSRPIHPTALKSLKPSSLTDADIQKVLDHSISEFQKAGSADKTAKGQEFTTALKASALVPTSSLDDTDSSENAADGDGNT